MNFNELLNDFWWNNFQQATEQNYLNFATYEQVDTQNITRTYTADSEQISGLAFYTPDENLEQSYMTHPIQLRDYMGENPMSIIDNIDYSSREPEESIEPGGMAQLAQLNESDPLFEKSEKLDESVDISNDIEKEPPVYDNAIDDISIGEGVAEAEAVSDPILLPVLMANQMLSGIGDAIASSKISDFNSQAYINYGNAMFNGHGIGYQSIANQNLQNSLNASNQYGTTTRLAGSIFGPAGALVSAFLSPNDFNSAPVTSYTVQTASGVDVNAQSASNINADSYDDSNTS